MAATRADLRAQVESLVAEGLSWRAAAKKVGVSPNSNAARRVPTASVRHRHVESQRERLMRVTGKHLDEMAREIRDYAEQEGISLKLACIRHGFIYHTLEAALESSSDSSE